MNVAQKYKIIEKGAIMHLLFNEKMPKIPHFVGILFGQCLILLFAPLYYPSAQETFDLCVRALMMTVTVLLMLIITSFVVTVLRITYIKDLEQREALKNQYRLSVGDVSSIAAGIKNDCLIVQNEGETAAQYQQRLNNAKQAATKTFWVLSIPIYSQHIVAYLHPTNDVRIIHRGELEWEKDMPLDQRIVAQGYDFHLETPEKYATYILLFVEDWQKHGVNFKIKTFDGDGKTQTEIAEKNLFDNK
jgi:hypothetical protein